MLDETPSLRGDQLPLRAHIADIRHAVNVEAGGYESQLKKEREVDEGYAPLSHCQSIRIAPDGLWSYFI
jgi:hypothetical protein